ncbi:MAG: hypothetical protein OXE17_12140 [Chloroflexi bacterium]|nr:hypothetical protein [Chloroflexota bacterium]
MIQDRDVQSLWDAVEEIRKKIEAMEGTEAMESTEAVGGAEAGGDVEFAFVASATSNRKTFHLRGCKFTHGFMKASNGFRAYRTHAEAVEDGRVPCKTCGA